MSTVVSNGLIMALSPSWPKLVAQSSSLCRPVGCRPVGMSPSRLSPSWFVAQLTVHHPADARSVGDSHPPCWHTKWRLLYIFYIIIYHYWWIKILIWIILTTATKLLIICTGRVSNTSRESRSIVPIVGIVVSSKLSAITLYRRCSMQPLVHCQVTVTFIQELHEVWNSMRKPVWYVWLGAW